MEVNKVVQVAVAMNSEGSRTTIAVGSNGVAYVLKGDATGNPHWDPLPALPQSTKQDQQRQAIDQRGR